MSRLIKRGTTKYTKVYSNDERGAGHANHEYLICPADVDKDLIGFLCKIQFQNGPVKEAGMNGIANEDLLVIVADRLSGFQCGKYACRENALALTKIEEALHWLRHRTAERESRGVEGTSIK